jgi:hypothetical protein
MQDQEVICALKGLVILRDSDSRRKTEESLRIQRFRYIWRDLSTLAILAILDCSDCLLRSAQDDFNAKEIA